MNGGCCRRLRISCVEKRVRGRVRGRVRAYEHVIPGLRCGKTVRSISELFHFIHYFWGDFYHTSCFDALSTDRWPTTREPAVSICNNSPAKKVNAHVAFANSPMVFLESRIYMHVFFFFGASSYFSSRTNRP